MAADIREGDLDAIEALIEKGSHKSASESLKAFHNKFPKNPRANRLLGRAINEVGYLALGRLCFEASLAVEPDNAETLWHYGKTLLHMDALDEAHPVFERMLAVNDRDWRAHVGLSTVFERAGQFDECIQAAEAAIDINPNADQAHSNLGFALLFKRDFDRGWKEFHWGLGRLGSRDKHTYVAEREWSGRKRLSLGVYSEQGIGDQVAGFEIIPDLCKQNPVAFIECDPKLVNWFRRCFTDVQFVGNPRPMLESGELSIDASINMYGVHQYLRESEDAYSKQPYLTPEPTRLEQWTHTLGSGSQPVIGIAWSGGVVATHADQRRFSIDELKRLMCPDAVYVSLEYQDGDISTQDVIDVTGCDVREYPWATRSPDYEDTAALIAACDLIVTPCTTTVHAAGAMGVNTLCVVHRLPNHHYGIAGSKMPYYDSVEMIRREDGDAIGIAAEKVEALCKTYSESLSDMTQAKIALTA